MLLGEGQDLFKASTKQPNRLGPYGYYNRVSHTSLQLFLSKETQSKLQLVLLSMKTPLTKEQHAAYTAERLVVKARKFAGHHVYHGGAAISHLSCKLKAELRVINCMPAQVPDQPCRYMCPQGHSGISNFQFHALDVTKSIWCYDCKSSHSSVSWKCPCTMPWHQCPIHFSACTIGENTSAVTTTATSGRGKKRPTPVSSATSARSLARLEPSIASKLCLPPSLAARFPHVVKRESGNMRSGGLTQGPDSSSAQSPTTSPLNPPPMHS